MRHRLGNSKLAKTSSHRIAMLNNMVVSLIEHLHIKTTLAKAKSLRPYIEKLITKAKKATDTNQLAVRRYLLSRIKSNDIVNKLLELSKNYINRAGGYTRILKAGFRYGDMAKVAYIELVDNVAINKFLSKNKKETKISDITASNIKESNMTNQ